MTSLTVFDPKKVFTEVNKSYHAAMQHGWMCPTYRQRGNANAACRTPANT